MQMKSNRILATQGESLAREYLLRNGYSIITTNYTTPYGELDIVAKDNDSLVVVEVKTRSGHNLPMAENSISLSKQKKLTRTAMEFIAANEEYSHLSCRFDVIILFYYAKEDNYKLYHYRDAFKPIFQSAED